MPTLKRDRSTSQPVPQTARTRWRLRGRLVFATSVVALALTASTAQAGGEFEDAFEAELGRITAQHFATLGQLVILGRHPTPIETVERVHVVERHVHGRHCGHRMKRHHRHAHAAPKKHWRKHRRHHRHWKKRNPHRRHRDPHA